MKRRAEGSASPRLAHTVYERIKDDLTELRMIPGERFSENEIADRLGVSRTPVREALYRLEQEGYVVVATKSGWTVRPFDFDRYEALYDFRLVIEAAVVRRLCEREPRPALEALKETWLVTPEEREADGARLAALDETFHRALVEAAGNAEMTRVYADITDRIRPLRRLELTSGERIRQTYVEHGQILRAIMRRKVEGAEMLLRSHIEIARSAVREITLHRLTTIAARNKST